MTQPKIEKTQRLTGIALRNRSSRLIDAANLDYSPKYLGVNGETDNPVDGLIFTPMGYYRLAEDTRDGTRVLLHSYNAEQLTGERDAESNVRVKQLAHKDYDIYAISARQNVRGPIFRDDMNHDIRFLERALQQDLNLHAEEIVPEGKKKQRRMVRLANGRVAFGLFETKSGKWRLRSYFNLRAGWDRSGRFVHINESAPPMLGSLFSLGRTVRDFDSYEDAFQYTRRFWKAASMRLFKGRTTLADLENLKGWEGVRARALAWVTDFYDNRKYRPWIVAMPVGLTVGVISTVFSGTPLLGALAGLGTAAGWSIGGKLIEDYVYNRWTSKAILKDHQELEALLPYVERNKVKNYLAKDAANEKRIRPKVKPDAIPHLRLLDHTEGDMNYDDGNLSPLENPMKDYERLSSTPYRYFGAVFDSTHHDDNLIAGIYPNGLVALIHADAKTKTTRHYLAYREDFDEFKGAKKGDLSAGLENLPGGKGTAVHKISHRAGRDFRYAALNGDEFVADLMGRIGPQAKDFKAFGMRLQDLFRVKARDDLAPAITLAQPVEKLTLKV